MNKLYLTGARVVLHPSDRVKDFLCVGQQFEAEEQAAFAEIKELENRINQTENAEERDALQLVLVDKVAKFENLQRRNRNRLEAMHRIELFQNSKREAEQTQ